MVHTNKELTIYHKKEANYGGGDAGIEYAKTHAAATTGYTAFNYLAGPVTLGGVKYLRTRLKAPGIGLGKGIMATTGVEYPTIEFSYYLQGADATFGALAVAGTEGAAGDSYTFNIVVPDPDETTASETWTVFGAQLLEYVVSGGMGNDKPPFVTVKWIVYDVVEDPGPVDFSAVSVPVTAVQEWEDFTVTVEAAPITEVKEFTFSIINKYTDIKSGRNSSFAKFKCLLTDKFLEYKITFYKEEGIIVEDPMLATINDNTTVLCATGVETYTITNCYMDDSDFLNNYTGDDIVEQKYSVTYKNGNSTFGRA